MNIISISPDELAKLFQNHQTVALIDVRTPVEYREVHVANARNVPLDRLDPAAVMSTSPHLANHPLYLICHKGSRGETACEKFLKAGFANVFNVEGGTQACIAAGLPVVRGKKTVSLDRQVRISAGSLVLLGVLLGRFLHPAWFILSGFLGAGLVFSGITNTCGMAWVLARMPWNQCNPAADACLCSASASSEEKKGPV
jgi:rhodanese-related sulfurtransferase